jgi:antitoxin ParD1/3/4
MNISLSPETQKLIEERMKRAGYRTADEAVRSALETMEQFEAEELDDQTLAEIEEGEAQLDRGEGLPLKEAFEQLRKKHLGARRSFV